MSTELRQSPTSSSADTNADSAAATAVIELPFDACGDDIRFALLGDYEKCLGRHDVTLTDLLRIHQQQQKMATKLTLSLQRAKQRQDDERNRGEELARALNDLANGMADLNDASGHGGSKVACVEEVRKMLGELKDQADDFRKKKDEIERRCLEAKTKEWGAEQKARKELEEKIKKLTQDIEGLKSEIRNVLRTMNCNLALLNQRLSSNYCVPEELETIAEVRRVLDMILFEVTNLLEGKRRVEEEVVDLKRQIEDLNLHIAHMEKMLDFMEREVAKLLTIGGRRESANVNRSDYNQVAGFVYETFDILLNKLRAQNKEMEKRKNDLNCLEEENGLLQREYERELEAKKARADELKRQIDNLNFQNEMLRNALRNASQLAESQKDHQAEAERMIKKVDKMKGTGPQLCKPEPQEIKPRNGESLKELDKLSNDIDEMDDKLAEKRRELEDLKRANEQLKESGERKNERLDEQIAQLKRDIQMLQDELARTQQQSPLEEREKALRGVDTESDRLLNSLDERLKAAEQERAKLLEQLRKVQELQKNACGEFAEERGRRQDVEDQLQACLDKIEVTERKLCRERKAGSQQSKPVQFVSTAVTLLNVNSGEVVQLAASASPCQPESPNVADKEVADKETRSSKRSESAGQRSDVLVTVASKESQAQSDYSPPESEVLVQSQKKTQLSEKSDRRSSCASSTTVGIRIDSEISIESQCTRSSSADQTTVERHSELKGQSSEGQTETWDGEYDISGNFVVVINKCSTESSEVRDSSAGSEGAKQRTTPKESGGTTKPKLVTKTRSRRQRSRSGRSAGSRKSSGSKRSSGSERSKPKRSKSNRETSKQKNGDE